MGESVIWGRPLVRSHSALYVDAGYLLAAAATRVTGTSYRRGITVDFASLIAELVELVEGHSGLPLLRVYWYDAAHNSVANPDQEKIALLPRVKLRLGRIGVEGEQKGVDLRIGLDMVGHARNAAVDTIYLLSGDDDLTEAVEEAQALGVQVTVLAVPAVDGVSHGVSRHLLRAVDGLQLLDGRLFENTVTALRSGSAAPPAVTTTPTESVSVARVPNPAELARRSHAGGTTSGSTPAYSGNNGGKVYVASEYQRDPAETSAVIIQVVRKAYDAWSATASADQKTELLAGRPSIPRDLDRALLVDLSAALGDYNLSDPQRVELRSRFWDTVDDK
jgi:uncharacterized LabA/DUF88 family protein